MIQGQEVRTVQRLFVPQGFDRASLLGQALSLPKAKGKDGIEDVTFEDLTCDRVDLVGNQGDRQVIDLVFTRKW